ncbi:hypothetical protein YQE_00658, partial [Dendroctonus ponderosae]
MLKLPSYVSRWMSSKETYLPSRLECIVCKLNSILPTKNRKLSARRYAT